jgi:hypothetical protein
VPLTPEQYTIIGIFIVIAGAGLAKKWVFGWVYDAAVKTAEVALAVMTEDRNFWRDYAMAQAGMTNKVLDKALAKRDSDA